MKEPGVPDDQERWPLPSTWRWSTMGGVADVVGGGTPSTSDAANYGGSVPWITPADLSGYRAMRISRGARSITERGLARSSARMLPGGTVLFSSRAPIGYVAVAANPVATNQGFKSFVLGPGLSPEYVYFYLLRALPLALARASGTTFLEISGAKAATIPFPMAPRAEQLRVVAALSANLSRLDAATASLQRAQRNLKRYRASVLQAAVEGRLVPTEAELARKEGRAYEPASKLLERILVERRRLWIEREAEKARAADHAKAGEEWTAQDDRDLLEKARAAAARRQVEPVAADLSGLPGIPDGWCYARLEHLLAATPDAMRTGPFGTLLSKSEHLGSGIPVIGIENIQPMRFARGSRIHVSPEKAASLAAYDVVPGDVLVSRSGTVGEVCVAPSGLGEARFSTNVIRLRLLSPQPLADWIALLLNGSPLVRAQIHSLCVGTTRDFLNQHIMSALSLPMAPVDEQRRILGEVARLTSIADNTERQGQASAAGCRRLRQSILRWAFEGKLVDHDPNDEPASVLLERIKAERAAAGSDANTTRRKPRRKASTS